MVADNVTGSANQKKMTRLDLKMTEEVRQDLESLRDATQASSMSEVIARALAVYEFLWLEKKNGGKLVIKGPSGEKEVVLL